MTDKNKKFSKILGELKDIYAPSTYTYAFQPMDFTKKLSDEFLEWDKHRKEVDERETKLAYEKAKLPFRILYVEHPADGEEVWVFEEEDWEGSAGIGWHKTSMYGGYGKDNIGCNWWNEPVCGRCGGNPCWLPGEILESELPKDMNAWLAIRDEADRRVTKIVEKEVGSKPENIWIPK